MSFGAPLFLWMAALTAPVVALYILKVRRRAVTVPYLRLWQELVTETRARSLFQRLKRLLSLLLQLLILAALVFALARPSFEVGASEREHIVVVLDASASMQTHEEGGKSRFDLALERAREMVEKRSVEDEMMIVAASDHVEVLCPFTRSRLLLRDGLAAARVTNRSLDADRALSFAREVTAEKPHPRLRFLSDGNAGSVRAALEHAGLVKPVASASEPAPVRDTRAPSDAPPKPASTRDEHAELVLVGAETKNVGILRFAARKSSSLGTDFVLAVLVNHEPNALDVNLDLGLNGKTQKVVPVHLAAGEVSTQRFDMALPEGGTLRLAIDREDAFALDNVAYAIVRPSVLQRVVVVTPKKEQLQPFRLAFESMVDVVDETSMAVTTEEYAALSADERRADVTICAGALPANLAPQGNLVLFGTDLPSGSPAELVGNESEPSVWDWDRDHLINRYMNWRDLALPRARTLRVGNGATAVVSGFDGALVAVFDAGDRHVVYSGFDVTERLFPFRLAFPIFLRNAIAWFDVDEEHVLADTYPTGASITPLVRLAGDKATARYFEAGVARTLDLPLVSGLFHFDRTDECGPCVFQCGEREFATAVNLFDAAESSIAPDEAAPGDVEPVRRSSWLAYDPWVFAAIAALLLWAVEWAFYHRRITE